MKFPNIFSKATGSVVTKFHIKPPLAGGRKKLFKNPGHMTNMAVMPVHGTNISKNLLPSL